MMSKTSIKVSTAREHGSGNFTLKLNKATITVEGYARYGEWGAAFQSPSTHSRSIAPAFLRETLNLFGLTFDDLDPRIPPAIANAGGDHIVLALKSHEALKNMHYDQERGKALCIREGLVTFNLVYVESPQVFHSRNPFPVGGVFEDPATGSAAAALAGYLRDIDWPHQQALTVYQGAEMQMPSCIDIELTNERGASVKVAGAVRLIS